jgi:hypothetical protein
MVLRAEREQPDREDHVHQGGDFPERIVVEPRHDPVLDVGLVRLIPIEHR